ncbi:MAG TPA: sulfatase [Bacteroidales bacterium]|nr:sulfatase [Bacteroidales bacterium]
MNKTQAILLTGLAAMSFTIPGKSKQDIKIEKLKGVKPRNVIFILSDDHRYDFMSFMNKVPWLQTPNMDRMAAMGAHMQNAFVTTSLCSPSRASILTGQYAHTHHIVDNSAPEPKDNLYFPQYLQKAGYQTAFIGKWHMGSASAEPRKGFDHWVSFRGQGQYYGCTFNVDGKEVTYGKDDYTSKILTDYTIDFIKNRNKKKPFFVYLSHKAVHAMFEPAKQDSGKYKDEKIPYPDSYYLTATGEYRKHNVPEWVADQRSSWHGVDYMYHGQFKFEDFYKRYCETLLSVDRSIGRVLDYLKEQGMLESTVVFYMGDNGFMMGEMGLIDKRQSYEPSMRVPLLVSCPEMIKPETKIPQMVLNIDIAPTILELAGVKEPEQMQGRSFAPLLRGDHVTWRDKIFYEYFWEYYFPQTPNVYAVRTDRYKFVYHPGVWDADEFYDLREDPGETWNLIAAPEHQEMIHKMRGEIFDWLESTDGMQIPLKRLIGPRRDWKYKGLY